jgi:2-polyprenyl-3-methyl-5-hydroxy-6-metoxy-1,4-benzoquinol methylase
MILNRADENCIKMNYQQKVFEVFNTKAKVYQDKFMDFDLYHDTLDVFCEQLLKPNATVFEIGCGPGNITNYILKKRPDFRVTGIDLAPNMVALAQVNNPSASFAVMHAKDISIQNSNYDGIICGFCLPYLSKPEATKLISDCADIINPQGIIYLSTMEDDYEKSGYVTSSDGKDQLFTYYYQAHYLEELLVAYGFRLTVISRKEYPKSNGEHTTDLIMIAQKT